MTAYDRLPAMDFDQMEVKGGGQADLHEKLLKDRCDHAGGCRSQDFHVKRG